MSSELSITLFHYVPNKEKPGYLKFDRVATLQELADEINAVLDTIMLNDGEYSLKQAYEWLSFDRDLQKDLPLTTKKPQEVLLQAMFRHGNNEGYIIEIVLFDRFSGKYITPITIKFLSDEDKVWEGVRAISDAIHQGYFN